MATGDIDVTLPNEAGPIDAASPGNVVTEWTVSEEVL
jgi:hypothetical protein